MKTRISVALLYFIAGNALGAEGPPRTSVDFYCEAMTGAFVETTLSLRQTPMPPQQLKEFKKAEAEFFADCKSMPVVGGGTKLASDMTTKEKQRISCLGIAEGIAMVHVSRTVDRELHSQLVAKRSFLSAACASNREALLSDMSKHGPAYVLKQRY